MTYSGIDFISIDNDLTLTMKDMKSVTFIGYFRMCIGRIEKNSKNIKYVFWIIHAFNVGILLAVRCYLMNFWCHFMYAFKTNFVSLLCEIICEILLCFGLFVLYTICCKQDWFLNRTLNSQLRSARQILLIHSK